MDVNKVQYEVIKLLLISLIAQGFDISNFDMFLFIMFAFLMIDGYEWLLKKIHKTK